MSKVHEPSRSTLPTSEESNARFVEFNQEMAQRLRSASLAGWWAERVALTPNNIVLKTDIRDLTYAQLDALSDRVARSLEASGVEPGNVVSIQLPSSAAFLTIILGASKLGVQISLLSPSLRGRPLRHALEEIPPRLIFLTPSAHAAIREIQGLEMPVIVELEVAATVPLSPDDSALGVVEEWVADLDVHAETADWSPAGPTQDPAETLFYIFTSGTTGLPKATQCSHARYVAGATSEGVLFRMEEGDCMYVFLPMFHIAALSSLGAALSVGASVAIRPRFSASRFWVDVRRFSATQFQYLGEIIRYLLAKPPSEDDRSNSLKAILGAGLTKENWCAFDERFGPLRVVESYGSSEGVIGIINLDGVPGSVGRPPKPLADRLRLVKYDRTADELHRNAAGRLVQCAKSEAGELIARLEDRSEFEGYSSEEATRSKLLENAFDDGDLWYRSGDLFREEEGYFYFVSRLGDSYRWKGENISAMEVMHAISSCDFVAHATVYPVQVPGHEGSAGMALVSILGDQAFSGEALFAALAAELPLHAFPLFVRVGDGQSVLTDTYKLGLATLKAEGYSLTIDDPLFVLAASKSCYVPLNKQSLTAVELPPFGLS